jgi:uncharacterized protein (TIGR03067 family)
MTKFTVPLVFAILVFAGGQTRSADNQPGDRNAPLNFIGDYTIVAGEKYGQKEPDDLIVGTQVHFTGDRVSVEDKDHKSTPYIATYVVATDKKPYVITMTSLIDPTKGEVVKGLIEKDGDQVRLIYALPGSEPPTEFKTKDKQLMFVMKSTTK